MPGSARSTPTAREPARKARCKAYRDVRERARPDRRQQFEILPTGQCEALGIFAGMLGRTPEPTPPPEQTRSLAPHPLAAARRATSVERPSERSIIACTLRLAARKHPSAMRGSGRRKARSASSLSSPLTCCAFRVSSRPARAAPSAPVTASTSPGRPPARVFAFEGRTSPTTVIAIVAAPARDRSPPTIAILQCAAHAARPRIELYDLLQARILRKTERNRRKHRPRTHCGQIARVGRHRSPPGICKGHRVASKMDAFDEHVGRDRASVRARGLPKRCVVPDAQLYPSALRSDRVVR